MKYYLGSPAEGIWGWNKYIKEGQSLPHTPHPPKKKSCYHYRWIFLWMLRGIFLPIISIISVIRHGDWQLLLNRHNQAHPHLHNPFFFFVCFNRKHGRNDWWWSVQGECVHIEPSACQTESFTWHILLRQAPSRWQPSWWPLGHFLANKCRSNLNEFKDINISRSVYQIHLKSVQRECF